MQICGALATVINNLKVNDDITFCNLTFLRGTYKYRLLIIIFRKSIEELGILLLTSKSTLETFNKVSRVRELS